MRATMYLLLDFHEFYDLITIHDLVDEVLHKQNSYMEETTLSDPQQWPISKVKKLIVK